MSPGYLFNIRSKSQRSRSQGHKHRVQNIEYVFALCWRQSSGRREFALFARYRVPAIVDCSHNSSVYIGLQYILYSPVRTIRVYYNKLNDQVNFRAMSAMRDLSETAFTHVIVQQQLRLAGRGGPLTLAVTSCSRVDVYTLARSSSEVSVTPSNAFICLTFSGNNTKQAAAPAWVGRPSLKWIR